MTFDQDGNLYPTLVSLLRSQCPEFDELLSTNEGKLLMYRLKGEQQQRKQQSINLPSETDDSGMGNSVSALSTARTLTTRRAGSHQRISTINTPNSRRSHTDVISQLRGQGFGNANPPLPSLKNVGDISKAHTKPSGDQVNKR